jgi:LacI family transcriptional regulator
MPVKKGRSLSGKNQREPRAKVTMQAVAERAGTSLSSVSRVLHNYPGIHPELRHRIEQAMRELGYAPPAARQRFITVGRRLIHFLLTNRDLQINPHARIFQAIEKETSRRGDVLIYKSLQCDLEVPAARLPLADLLDVPEPPVAGGPPVGVVLTGPTSFGLLKRLDQLNVPYAVLGNNYVGPDQPATNAVYFDGYQGACESARYLIDLGHRKILFVGDPHVGWFSGPYQGYLDTMKQAGLEPVAQSKTLSDSFYSNGYLSVQLAFEQSSEITAVFAGCDEIALGAWKALNDRNLTVPRDISLIGFDDEDYAAYTVPPLSTVRIDVDAIGRELISLLYARLEDPEQKLPSVRLPSNLIKRGTCRPVMH